MLIAFRHLILKFKMNRNPQEALMGTPDMQSTQDAHDCAQFLLNDEKLVTCN